MPRGRLDFQASNVASFGLFSVESDTHEDGRREIEHSGSPNE